MDDDYTPTTEVCAWCSDLARGTAIWEGTDHREPSCGRVGHGIRFEPRMRPEPVSRAEAVSTGQPEAQLLACTRCGVLLWDIEAHYAHAHPDRENGSRDA